MSTRLKVILAFATIIAIALLTGCAAKTGPAGPAGPPGPPGPEGPAGPAGGMDAVSLAQPESCVICHSDVGEAKHQSIYDRYTDATTLGLTIDDVTSAANSDGTFTSTITFSITKDGMPYIDANGLPSLEQKTFYAVTYDSATRMFTNSKSFASKDIVALGGGRYSVTATDIKYAPEASNGQIYAYIADGLLDTESGGHVHMYDDVASAAMPFGDVATYESLANVSGCEKCHGTPYMKHGYRAPEVDGLSDFSSCKSCHYDDRTGGHQDWQVLVNDPARYVELTDLAAAAAAAGDRDHDSARENMTQDELDQYGYTANIMNDVHMSHSMEFPYPQSISNCATCHEGKLDRVLADDNFKAETCLSCHPVDGPEEGTDPHRAPALNSVMPEAIHAGLDLKATACTDCHGEGKVAEPFNEIHTGYDKHIYVGTTGTKYSEVFTASIDSVSLSGNTLDIKFSARKNAGLTDYQPADIIPTVLVGLYGYDTKDFIVAAHGRDADDNRLLEFQINGETQNPRFNVVSAAGGSWEVTADLSMWSDLIADGTVRRAEISVLPLLADVVGEIDTHANEETDDTVYALNAPSRTFDFNANAFDDGFYGDIVDVENGCNTCHDALATTFHSGDRGGNIRVCRTCHVVLSGASHLEIQSRSIDSYVHAIHSFQDFDIGDIDFTDPVAAKKYELHTEHVFPNFTIKNCEACHVEGAFNVPDQTKSLPGILSAADETPTLDRDIGAVPSYVTGPAARACGGCHRAEFIKEDDANKLAAFYQHTKAGGYMIENSGDTLDEVIQAIMAKFK